MPRVGVDFENVDVPIDPGKYIVEVTGADLKTTKSDGSTMIVWELSIQDEGPFFGRKLYFNSNLADKRTKSDGSPDMDGMRKANYYLREFLKAIGAPWDPDGFETEQALHCRGIADVDHREFEGRTLANVKMILPLPSDG